MQWVLHNDWRPGQGSDFGRPTGFYRQMKLPDPSNATNHLYHAAVQHFKRHWDGLPVRKVALGISQFSNEAQYQLTLCEVRNKYRALERTTDALKQRFRDTVKLRAASITQAGQARDRAGKIGGHFR